jgi:hypothetical protein
MPRALLVPIIELLICRNGLDLTGSAIAPDLRLCDLVFASIRGTSSAEEKDLADSLRHFFISPRPEREEVIAKRKVISEVRTHDS